MQRALVTGLMVIMVAGCASPGSGASPADSMPAGPAASPVARRSISPSGQASVAPTPFPVWAFAELSDEPLPSRTAARLQAALERMAGGGGITATVMTADGSWSGAIGKADGVDDLQPDSQFGIASGTKPVVAAQVLQLVEAGEIDLDRPATDYLPADFEFDTNGATIRQLLSHRSGIPDWYNDAVRQQVEADRSRAWTVQEVLALVPSARRPPGVAHEYADTNYNLLEMVIEHVAGRPLVDVLRNGVLRVAGTERLVYQPAEVPTDPMAMPRGESREALEQGGGYLPSLSEATTCGAACAFASDAISLARWWKAFCGGEIVSAASLTEMAAFYGGPEPYGLGLMNPVHGRAKAVGHLGASFGYVSASGCVTEEPIVFVVLTNQLFPTPTIAVPLVLAAMEADGSE